MARLTTLALMAFAVLLAMVLLAGHGADAKKPTKKPTKKPKTDAPTSASPTTPTAISTSAPTPATEPSEAPSAATGAPTVTLSTGAPTTPGATKAPTSTTQVPSGAPSKATSTAPTGAPTALTSAIPASAPSAPPTRATLPPSTPSSCAGISVDSCADAPSDYVGVCVELGCCQVTEGCFPRCSLVNNTTPLLTCGVGAVALNSLVAAAVAALALAQVFGATA